MLYSGGMKRYILSHVPMALLYALGVFLLRGLWPLGDAAHYLDWVWWMVGVVIGVLLLFLDRVVYVYNYPAEQLSQYVRWYVQQKKYGEALALLDARRLEQDKLTFRSALFMALWVPIAFFALTSTAGLLGKGVVMGLMFHILADAWRLQTKDPRRLHTRLFWLIKRPFSDEERLVFMWVMTGIFVLLSLWVG